MSGEHLANERGPEGPYRGVQAPQHFGDLETESRALREGFAAVHRSWVSGLVLEGADRHRFLNSQTTCDVKELANGAGVFGFFVTAKGRVEADVSVLAFEDRIWLELPPGTAEAIRERLEKYKVVDRVEISPLEHRAITLTGAAAAASLERRWSDLPSAELEHSEVQLAGVTGRLVREPDLAGHPVWTLWLPTGGFEAAWAELQQGDAPATPVGWQAWERHRLQAGRPVFGLDFGPDCFPQETGFAERGISYTKGCYLGQEVVARIHYRGGVQRRMCRLTFDAAAAGGHELHADGKKVGTVGSAAAVDSGWIGLGVVHGKAEDGATLEVVDGDGDTVTRAVLASL